LLARFVGGRPGDVKDRPATGAKLEPFLHGQLETTGSKGAQ
jgi:hypothetical protein